jgi:putative transport protein
MQTASVVVTSGEVNGATLESLAQDPSGRGVYLESIQRGPEMIPNEAWTVLQRGDLLRLVGAPDHIARAAARIGYVERDLSRTDLTYWPAPSAWACWPASSRSTPAASHWDWVLRARSW